MVNRGEEKVRVHINVVPRSTKNTNGGTILVNKVFIKEHKFLAGHSAILSSPKIVPFCPPSPPSLPPVAARFILSNHGVRHTVSEIERSKHTKADG